MNQTFNYFSRNSLIAIYLLLKALRKGVDEVQLTYNCLRSFLKRERLYESIVFKFAESMKPFFPSCGVTMNKDLILSLRTESEEEGKEDNSDKFDLFNYAKQRAKRDMIKREVVHSLPEPSEIDEKLIAKEVAECISKYMTIKRVVLERHSE